MIKRTGFYYSDGGEGVFKIGRNRSQNKLNNIVLFLKGGEPMDLLVKQGFCLKYGKVGSDHS